MSTLQSSELSYQILRGSTWGGEIRSYRTSEGKSSEDNRGEGEGD